MTKYIEEMLKEFPESLTGTAQQPWSESLFETIN